MPQSKRMPSLLEPIPKVGETFQVGFSTCVMTKKYREQRLKLRRRAVALGKKVEKMGLDRLVFDDLMRRLRPELRQKGWKPSRRSLVLWKKQGLVFDRSK